MYMMYKCFMVLKIILTEGLGGRICSTCNMLEKGKFQKSLKNLFYKEKPFLQVISKHLRYVLKKFHAQVVQASLYNLSRKILVLASSNPTSNRLQTCDC